MQRGLAVVLFGVVAAMTMVHRAEGHSWIACTDYLELNSGDWDASKCRAYPRHGWKFTPKDNFGLDKGYNLNNPSDGRVCRTARNDQQAYNNNYPMAAYYKGQTVVIAHPTKNHVADVRCTNKYIPDKGNKVHISQKSPQSDPTLTAFKSGFTIDLGVAPVGWEVTDAITQQYPKPGFQNAPKFCQNPDKALATNSFVIPDLEPGRYTFLWAWYFNSLNNADLYTSCWEADVYNTRQERDSVLQQRGQSTQAAIDVMTGASLDGQGNQGISVGGGSQGNQGNQGQNNQGNQGNQGQNNQGNQGNQGQNNQGNQGNQGQNNQGNQGQNNQGNQGQNNQGNQGQNNQGNQGNQGQNNQGNQGNQNCQNSQNSQTVMPGANGQIMKCTCACEAMP